MVAARCGDSGRRRTFSRLCPREVIRVFTIGGSSCCHWLEVVSTTGRERDNRPVAGTPDHLAVAVAQPVMAEHFQMYPGGVIQVRLKRHRLSLLVPTAQQPLHRQGRGSSRMVTLRILKPVRGKTQMHLQPRGTNPVGVHDAGTVGARRLNSCAGRAFPCGGCTLQGRNTTAQLGRPPTPRR